jgi:hypothetical protein
LLTCSRNIDRSSNVQEQEQNLMKKKRSLERKLGGARKPLAGIESVKGFIK